MSYRRDRRLRISTVALGAVLVVASGCGGSNEQESAPSAASTVADAGHLLDPAEFATVISDDDVTVINVHVPHEGEIDGTDAFIAFDTIGSSTELPTDLDAPIALYCRSGNMSATATETLVDLGYTDVVDLAGGMKAWAAAGQPLVES